jgi:hypothetical protein
VDAAQEAMRSCFVKGGSLEALRLINAKLLNASSTTMMTADAQQTGNVDAMLV